MKARGAGGAARSVGQGRVAYICPAGLGSAGL